MNPTTKILVTALLILAIISSSICIGAADADDIGGGGTLPLCRLRAWLL